MFFAANGSASPRLPSVITTSTTVPDTTTTTVPDTTTTTAPDTTTTTCHRPQRRRRCHRRRDLGRRRRPSAPTSLVASRGGRSSVLTWSPPVGDGGSPITGYVVIRSNPGSSTWTVLSSSVPANTWTYTATGLTFGATYWYRVAAGRRGRPGSVERQRGARDLRSANRPAERPRQRVRRRPAHGLVATSAEHRTALGPQLHGRRAPCPVRPPGCRRSSPGILSLNVAGLQPGARYYFRVAATTAAGTGPASPSVFGTPWGLASAPRSVVASTAVGRGRHLLDDAGLHRWRADPRLDHHPLGPGIDLVGDRRRRPRTGAGTSERHREWPPTGRALLLPGCRSDGCRDGGVVTEHRRRSGVDRTHHDRCGPAVRRRVPATRSSTR